ncbi:hypothetical protein EVAR_96932_1 [Eumeta japonica]|uniref:Uncharacterized protein n=1 Tax=Eumeta variegata TaxID=151549 RepID=A0A4C1ZQI7_EUMVA|nr:hypothetical protein EVAR_96932_1 [Eumeta japonica]
MSVPTDLTKRTLENQKIRAKIEKPTQWWKEFGFTRGRSVINADAVLVQQIFGAWENSQDVVAVFCDLSKASGDALERSQIMKF